MTVTIDIKDAAAAPTGTITLHATFAGANIPSEPQFANRAEYRKYLREQRHRTWKSNQPKKR